MASIKVKFRPSMIADRDGVVFYQIIHERKVRQLTTVYHLKPDEWDETRSMVKPPLSGDRKQIILSIRDRIRRDIDRLIWIGKRFEAEWKAYSPDDLIDEFRRYEREYSLFNFMENLIVKLRRSGKTRTSETYTAALNSFRKFSNYEDVMLDSLTSEVMMAYEAWHKSRGNSPNTISFYNRILRAVYHRAVNDDVIENRDPFRHVYTGVDKTVKRAISLSCVRRIKGLDLSLSLPMDYARDMFMMSFYLRGMSFIDMTFLKKSDLKNGHIIYRRRKTGQQLTIEWTREMQDLLDKYPRNPTQYLLPIIMLEGINEHNVYRKAGYNINYSLKKVARLAGIDVPLTMYVARHSWASAAKMKGIPLNVISEGMGHDSEATTRIYLANLDTSVVDRANSIILSAL
ncbi:MAG: site-specific integrase [Muribaculaceae bacterium]|nr:site-specific integrase [Muribaculaceae bacterium]